MEDKYVLDLTRDELSIVLCALNHELDRIDVYGIRYDETKRLGKKVYDMYMGNLPLKRGSEHERSWINAERDRV